MDIVKALEKHGLRIHPTPALYSQTGKCYGCLFQGEYRDMGASTPICNREHTLTEAFNANKKPGPCQWYITKDQVRELQELLLKGE